MTGRVPGVSLETMGGSDPGRENPDAVERDAERGRDASGSAGQEATGGQPTDRAKKILAAADARDDAADARDAAAVERENALDKSEFLEREATYGDHWVERRAAGMDRARSQDDRLASRQDRLALTEDLDDPDAAAEP